MNNPKLYNDSNSIQRAAVLNCLTEYSNKIKWTEGDTAIDLGCGDGSVTTIVKNFPPHKFKKFVASDISERMVEFAKERYANEDMLFRVLDIEGDLSEDLIGEFNHVFSFYALQWVKNQEKAFSNIHNLLTYNGDCLLIFIQFSAIYDVYMALAQQPKWQNWLKNVDIFISPHNGIKNPEGKVVDIMEKCAFTNIDVKCNFTEFIFKTVEALKSHVQSIEPFNMPQEVFDELFKDFLTVGQEIGAVKAVYDNNNELISIEYSISFLIVFGNK